MIIFYNYSPNTISPGASKCFSFCGFYAGCIETSPWQIEFFSEWEMAIKQAQVFFSQFCVWLFRQQESYNAGSKKI